ncbi:MAG: hypothetical protein C4550_03615 [Nitrospiraceae bacterium]|nr:MAG: hypothetical protein C4550_03615 [Nitrospiraceae bacterium]
MYPFFYAFFREKTKKNKIGGKQMLNIKIAKEKDKAHGHWLSLPADTEEKLKVLRKLDEGEPIGTTLTLCITDVQSSIPNLKRYIHEHDPLKQLSILATRIEKMSDRDAAIFSGSLDMEAVNGLEDVMKIADSLGNYELFPDVTTPKELGVYLVESGEVEIHKSAWHYLDYERVAVEYESNNNGTYTNLGYVVKTGNNPEQTNTKDKQTIKFFSPLTIFTYPSYEYGECGTDDLPEELSSSEAMCYRDEILAAIEKEKLPSEGDRGLMVYFNEDKSLAQKVYSLHPTVEEWNGELWGVMVAEVYSELTEVEAAMLTDFAVGQMSDGWGEGFEQRPIKTGEGEIYVSFWKSKNFFIKPEQELKQNEAPELGCNTQMVGGM